MSTDLSLASAPSRPASTATSLPSLVSADTSGSSPASSPSIVDDDVPPLGLTVPIDLDADFFPAPFGLTDLDPAELALLATPRKRRRRRLSVGTWAAVLERPSRSTSRPNVRPSSRAGSARSDRPTTPLSSRTSTSSDSDGSTTAASQSPAPGVAYGIFVAAQRLEQALLADENNRFVELFKYRVVASHLLGSGSTLFPAPGGIHTLSPDGLMPVPRVGETGMAVPIAAVVVLVTLASITSSVVTPILLLPIAGMIVYGLIQFRRLRQARADLLSHADTLVGALSRWESVGGDAAGLVSDVDTARAFSQQAGDVPAGLDQTRTALSLAHRQLVTVLVQGWRQLSQLADSTAADQLPDVYGIGASDVREAVLAAEKPESGRRRAGSGRRLGVDIRLGSRRVLTARRLLLCTLLAVPATGTAEAEIRRADAVGKVLARVATEVTEQTDRIGAESTPGRPTGIAIGAGPVPEVIPMLVEMSQRLRATSALVSLLREDGNRLLSGSDSAGSFGADGDSGFATRFGLLGADLRDLVSLHATAAAQLADRSDRQSRRRSAVFHSGNPHHHHHQLAHAHQHGQTLSHSRNTSLSPAATRTEPVPSSQSRNMKRRSLGPFGLEVKTNHGGIAGLGSNPGSPRGIPVAISPFQKKRFSSLGSLPAIQATVTEQPVLESEEPVGNVGPTGRLTEPDSGYLLAQRRADGTVEVNHATEPADRLVLPSKPNRRIVADLEALLGGSARGEQAEPMASLVGTGSTSIGSNASPKKGLLPALTMARPARPGRGRKSSVSAGCNQAGRADGGFLVRPAGDGIGSIQDLLMAEIGAKVRRGGAEVFVEP